MFCPQIPEDKTLHTNWCNDSNIIVAVFTIHSANSDIDVVDPITVVESIR